MNLRISFLEKTGIDRRARTNKLKKGDMIYIFSDGYADQFGGPKGKKYMTTKFRKYLASISHHNMEEQHEMLKKEFQKWKGDHDQIDDVCVMGVRV